MSEWQAWLDGQEFHELCMDYRGAQPQHAQAAFKRLQEAISYNAGLYASWACGVDAEGGPR